MTHLQFLLYILAVYNTYMQKSTHFTVSKTDIRQLLWCDLEAIFLAVRRLPNGVSAYGGRLLQWETTLWLK